ncbi:MAG: OmpA family protein [Bacteroidota bacterium]|nr:OmpA family protein [Bacteroidota bacterium]
MKTIIKLKSGLRKASPFNTIIKTLITSALIFTGIQTQAQAQTDSIISQPSWWFGAVAGANFNFYNGSTQKLNADLTVPTPFHTGNGIGLFLGPLVEYYQAKSRWGFMFQAGYDNRMGKFKQILTPCNCPADLSTKLSYITVEPSLRFAPFKSDFYLYAGPRFAYNINKSFTYQQQINPAYPEQIENPEVKGDLSDVNTMIISAQVGLGYDIHLSPKTKQSQVVLSPFVSFQPYFGQSPRSIESWNITTVRAGAAIKFGRGQKYTAPLEFKKEVVVIPTPEAEFSINSPKNIPVNRRVRETFPVRNYVFFDLGSTEIPSRYVLLEKNQVAKFKEDQLEVFKPKNLSGRADRQMVVYYNVLNILGDRMNKKPTITIKLVGSSKQGDEDGKAMAESIKKYLVNTFGIEGSRIATEGNSKPANPSGVQGGTSDLDLIEEGNRRVTIETASPTLLMQFQSGPDAPLLPVEVVDVQEAPLDSYVTFNVNGAKEKYSSWTVEAKDKNGKIQTFGPYTGEKVSIPGKTILGDKTKGQYEMTMIGLTKDGKTEKKTETIQMALWTPPVNEQGERYSVLYNYDESKVTPLYEKYLTDVVTPKIPKGATVIVHGYTDILGEADYNTKLSTTRANDVKDILTASLLKSGRKDVTFEVYGFGEDEKLARFENKYPEQRFYNRGVVIDIIPKK